ncbi:MAG TPA: endonuclease III domain-containing protein [Candidatus Hydrogenedentes bacterium]|nr:endonuclease III domain-containing protein [Candidatus Hydrogenedentota bacterium]
MKDTLETIYGLLSAHYGPTHWWPGDTPFEIAVGAVLTQNAAWRNVEQAIENLKRGKLLRPRAILACPDGKLEEALRPSGYFRVKAKRLRSFCTYLVRRYQGSMAGMARRPLEQLRPELLKVNGIGPETADDILLYACEKPVFVVDAYTRRILERHGLPVAGMGYEELRALFETALAPDVAMFKEYHGLIVYAGKDFCRRKPHCEGCPLATLPVEDGPVLETP